MLHSSWYLLLNVRTLVTSHTMSKTKNSLSDSTLVRTNESRQWRQPFLSDDILKLTKTIFGTLELRETRVSLYDMFYFDTGFVLRIAASTFVYITVQLQLALPNLKDGHYVSNTTATT